MISSAPNTEGLREARHRQAALSRDPAGAAATNGSTVFIIDDDPAICESLRDLLSSVDLPVETFSSGQEFLKACDQTKPGCLVLDVRMPGMSGLDLQEELAARSIRVPVIFLTGYGEVPTAVRAMKNGAFDFIEKPACGDLLIDCVRAALESDRQARREGTQRAEVSARLDTLTPREREVVGLVVQGMVSKEIAAKLGIARKTVEVHRARIMHKMQAECVAHLVAMILGQAHSKED